MQIIDMIGEGFACLGRVRRERGVEERERKSPGTCGEAYVVDNKNGN